MTNRVREIIFNYAISPYDTYKGIHSIEDITPETSLEDLGLDSIEVVDLILAIEKDLDLFVKDSSLNRQFKTVGDIEDVFSESY